MKKASLSFLTIFSLFLFASGSSFAGEIKEIELNDGSVVHGEILSLSNGVYTVRTEAMGTITIKDASVRTIRSMGAAASTATVDPSQVQSLQKQMTSDPEIMSMIESLKDDPAFTKALEDPELMRAVSAGDVAALMANPKFMEIMNNSTVKNIQQKVTK